MNLVFRYARDDRQRGPVNMGRLGRHMKLQPAHRVEVGDAPARLERRGVTSLKPDAFLDPLRASRQRPGRAVLVADFPVIDVIRLALAIRTQDDLVFLRGKRIGDHRERVVVHLHGFDAVHRCSPRLGKDRGHLLILEKHLADRQHHLFVETVKRGQPAEPRRFEILAGDHSLDARHLQRLADVDRCDLGMWIGAAHDRHVQHAGKHDVFDVVTLALQEARIFLALHRDAQCVFGFSFDGHCLSPGIEKLAVVRSPWFVVRCSSLGRQIASSSSRERRTTNCGKMSISSQPLADAWSPRPAAPLSRCSDTPCTGTGSQPDLRESAPRSGRGCF